MEANHDAAMQDGGPSAEGPVVRDRRRIDPETGQVRVPASQPADAADVAADAQDPVVIPTPGGADITGEAAERIEGLATQLADSILREQSLTDDLQRLQAEYVNYRRRVERDRDVAREQTTAALLGSLLPILDDIGRAREHGDLKDTFKQVGESLEAALTKLGLTRYGEPGDPFDPAIHQALMHGVDESVDGPTCSQILFPGYRVGDRIIRPAMVAVVEPSA